MKGMPELPEVETVVRQLRPSLRGERLLDHQIFDEKLGHLRAVSFSGSQVSEVLRIGKHVVMRLSRRPVADSYLAIHLRMSGRLFWIPGRGARRGMDLCASLHARLPVVNDVSLKPAHIRFVVRAKGGTLVFADPRRFGTVEVVPSKSALGTGGVDPLEPGFSAGQLGEMLRGSRQPLKTWLLRQDRIAGIGNIYASEILFRARLDPARPAETLTVAEQRKLFRAIQVVLNAAIENCGTTFSDFQSPSGDKGGFQKFLRVYERESLPCRNCRGEIARVVQAGRSTYFCRRCQK